LKLENFIAEQMGERYKHFIIFGPRMRGKTKLAKHISEIFDGLYIDLLDDFQKDPGKKSVIDIFGPSKLIAYIKGIDYGNKKLMVIDQLDFLINTWDDSQFRELLVFVDQNQTEVCCMFVMHNYRILERETPIKVNDKGHNRLINIYNIQKGGTING
jgi:hypothetical protein